MKTLSKLTIKSLLMNKTRTLVTIIGIMLSAALITVVAGVFTSAQATLISSCIHESGDYDIVLDGSFTDENIKKLNMNRDIQDIGYRQYVGMAEIENTTSKYKKYALVSALNKTAFDTIYNMPLESGRYPKNSEEIVLSPSFVKYTAGKYKTGDKLELDVGNRVKTNEDDERNVLISAGLDEESKKYIFMAERYYGEGQEYIKPEFKKTYTVVGILSDVNSELVTDKSSSACMDVYTLSDSAEKLQTFDYLGSKDDAVQLRVNLTNEAESDPIKVLTQVTGCDTEYVNSYLEKVAPVNYSFEDSLYSSADPEMKSQAEQTIKGSNSFGISGFGMNRELLRFKGINISDSTMRIVLGFTGLIIFIIMISSIFIIRNSISISITEKTRLYGMLASVGTTPGQIRRNVIFESCILAVVGIPLGIGIGVGVTAGLMNICDYIVADNLNGSHLMFSVPLTAIAVAAVLSALTIYLSSVSIALSASKISPIAAIRGNRDVKINRGKKKKQKVYRTPGIITKLFGIGGSIAYKNLKRSKKQYRTTVISIVLSVSVYITIFSFVESALAFTGRYYDISSYNMCVVPYPQAQSQEISSAEQMDADIEIYEQIGTMDGVQKTGFDMNIPGFLGYYPTKDIIVDKSRDFSYTRIFHSEQELTGDETTIATSIMTVDDNSYKEFLALLGKDPSEMKGKAILNNSNTYYYEGKDGGKNEKFTSDFLKDPEGLKISLDGIEKTENKQGKHDFSIEVGAVFTDELINENMKKLNPGLVSTIEYPPYIIVDRQTYREIVNSDYSSMNIYLYSENATKTEEAIRELTAENGAFINNYEYIVKSMNAIVTILEIFIYGFIIVIAAIGLTNIFNTITTNMSLRRKEFAMLQSVGMTRKEFRRMVDLESVMYAAKSLAIALPLGIGGGIAVNWIFNVNLMDEKMAYQFPWLAILISIAAVVGLVWLIMTFSLSKLKKQNIIETIRNDNI